VDVIADAGDADRRRLGPGAELCGHDRRQLWPVAGGQKVPQWRRRRPRRVRLLDPVLAFRPLLANLHQALVGNPRCAWHAMGWVSMHQLRIEAFGMTVCKLLCRATVSILTTPCGTIYSAMGVCRACTVCGCNAVSDEADTGSWSSSEPTNCASCVLQDDCGVRVGRGVLPGQRHGGAEPHTGRLQHRRRVRSPPGRPLPGELAVTSAYNVAGRAITMRQEKRGRRCTLAP